MKLTIKYFGMIEEAVGKTEEVIEFPSSLSVDRINSELRSIYPAIVGKSYQIAINQTIQDSKYQVVEDCEVALLPPFAGG